LTTPTGKISNEREKVHQNIISMDNRSADTHFVLPMVLKEKLQTIATSLDND